MISETEAVLHAHLTVAEEERDHYKQLLGIARGALKYALEDHHLDGDECLCQAARSTIAAGLSLTEEAPDAV